MLILSFALDLKLVDDWFADINTFTTEIIDEVVIGC